MRHYSVLSVFVVFVGLLVAFPISAQSPERLDFDNLNPPVDIRPAENVAELCDGGRLDFSPSGRFLTAWRPGKLAVVFPTDCILSGGDCLGWNVVSVSDFGALLWTPSDFAYIVPGDGPVRLLQPQNGVLETDRNSVLLRFPDHVGSHGLINPAGPAWDAGLDAPPSAYKPLGMSFRLQGVDHALLDRNTHRITVVIADGSWLETSLSGRWSGFDRTGRSISDLTPAHDAEGRLYLAGSGIVHRLDGDGMSPALPALYQPRPIIDASTGVLVGGHDDRNIQWLDGRSVDSALTQEPEIGLDWIHSVAVASAADAYAVRLVGRDKREAIVIKRGNDPIRRIECPVSRIQQRRAAIPSAGLTIEDWGRPGRPLMVRRRTLDSGSRGLAVIWRGGPGDTFAAGGAEYYERDMLSRGFDTALIDGSGSQGVELGARLRDSGFSAVLEDAEDAARYLDSTEDRDRPILIRGESFGGVAGAETARRLAALRPGTPRPALMLGVPWVRYRDPAEYNGEGREGSSVEYMRGSDQAAFGDVDAYAAGMSQWRATYRYDGPTLVIFAAADRSVRREDLWDTSVNASNIDVRIIAGIDHRFVGSHPATLSAVEEWLSGRFPEAR